MYIYLIIFIFGLVFGSFMNVVIYRLPRGLSIIRPASRCPDCGNAIKPCDNIPVLSFLILKGRCRYCGTRISLRYPTVEFLNGILWVICVYRFGLSLSVLPVFFLISSMIVITFIDLEHLIIPDHITIPGTLIGLALSPFMVDPFFRIETLGINTSLIGATVGVLLFLGIAFFGRMLFKKEALGGGDIKLMAMVGAFTGWKGVIVTTFIGSLIGSIVGIFIILRRKKREGVSNSRGPVIELDSETVIPFGPYLSIGAILSILMGQEIWSLYL